MFLGVRHGERVDQSADPIEQARLKLPYDPQLTKIGELQAQSTANAIQKKIEDYEQMLIKLNLFSKKIQPVIICSPFLRTIQTSYQIAQNLESVYENTIFLQDDIMELLDKDNGKNFGFESDPRPKLCSKLMKLEDYSAYGLDFINSKIKLKKSMLLDEEYREPVFPESKAECDKRIEKFIGNFSKLFFKKFKFNEFALIWVTHQYCLGAGCWFLRKTNIQEYPLSNVGYCGILDCRFEDPENGCQNYKVMQWGTNEHLKL